jgi:hypothetical protein
MTMRTRIALSRAIMAIESQGLHFRRAGMQWEAIPTRRTTPASATPALYQETEADRKVFSCPIGNGVVINIVHGQ